MLILLAAVSSGQGQGSKGQACKSQPEPSRVPSVKQMLVKEADMSRGDADIGSRLWAAK